MSIILDFDRTISLGALVQVFTASYSTAQWEYAILTDHRGTEHFLERILGQHLAENTYLLSPDVVASKIVLKGLTFKDLDPL